MNVVIVFRMQKDVMHGQKTTIKEQNFLLIFFGNMMYTIINETGLEI